MTSPALPAAAASCAAALVLTPVVRNVSRKAGWLDRPDGARKRHAAAVPPSGGIAVLLALLVGAVWMGFDRRGMPPGLAAATLIVFAGGLLDDLANLPPWKKLLPQIGAALLAVRAGLCIGSFAGSEPATVFWLLLCTNAFNLLDGMDGVAAVAASVAGGAMLWMSSGAEGILAPLIGALCGFLWFNRPRATVFLGDSGSLTVGFLMGCAALRTGDSRVVGMAGPLIALALPLADTAWAVARRLWRRKRLFQGDTEHFHHRVLAWAGTPGRALLVLGGASLGAALLGAAVQTLAPGSNP